MPCEAGPAQPKTGRGAGQSPAALIRREAPRVDQGGFRPSMPLELRDSDLAPLIEFIRILDRWDREAHGN